MVRGEDHLSNTPKQLLVLEAAQRPSGFGARTAPLPPLYAHLPLLHGPDGKKLSKRHGAASVQELRDAGYLPEAVRNYLALLGWGAGDDATVLSTEELIERFTLERVSRNPARFDEVKLRWLNGVYIRSLPLAELDPAPGSLHGARGPRAARRASARRRSTRSPTSGRWPGRCSTAPRRSEGARALARRGRPRGAGRGARGARAAPRASTRRPWARRSKRS